MTFSILARCETTGQLGVAVASAVLAAGTHFPAARPGVGVAVVQAGGRLPWRRTLLELLELGFSPAETIGMLARNPEAPSSQFAALSHDGAAAAYTGPGCQAQAGHETRTNVSTQANMMISGDIWGVMAESFQAGSGPLAERLVAALSAADRLGADYRGRQSAAVLVVSAERGFELTGEADDPTVDLRVDDADRPVEQLLRLVELHRAHRHLARAGSSADDQEAGRHLREAGAIAPRDRIVAPLVAISEALERPGPAAVTKLRQAAEINPATFGWARRRAEQAYATGRASARELLDLLDTEP